MEDNNLFPDLLEQAVRAGGIPDDEISAVIDLLTFSLIAHL